MLEFAKRLFVVQNFESVESLKYISVIDFDSASFYKVIKYLIKQTLVRSESSLTDRRRSRCSTRFSFVSPSVCKNVMPPFAQIFA